MQAFYQILNHKDGLVVVDAESGERIGKVHTTTQITASTDSHSVVEECREWLIGPVESVEHDKDTIHVVCTVPAKVGITPEGDE